MSIDDRIRAFEFKGAVIFYVPHRNGEEALLVEIVDERSFSTGWTAANAAEKMLAMGRTEVDVPLPEAVRPLVERRLAEEREPPSAIMRSMGF